MLKAHPGQHMCSSIGGRTSMVPTYLYQGPRSSQCGIDSGVYIMYYLCISKCICRNAQHIAISADASKRTMYMQTRVWCQHDIKVC